MNMIFYATKRNNKHTERPLSLWTWENLQLQFSQRRMPSKMRGKKYPVRPDILAGNETNKRGKTIPHSHLSWMIQNVERETQLLVNRM